MILLSSPLPDPALHGQFSVVRATCPRHLFVGRRAIGANIKLPSKLGPHDANGWTSIDMQGIPRPMPAEQNRVRVRPIAGQWATDERAGVRTPNTTVGGRPAEIPGLREDRPTRKPEASRRLPKHLRIMSFAPPPRPQRPSSAAKATPPPPLAAALERAGLGHYVKKLCDDMSAATVEELRGGGRRDRLRCAERAGRNLGGFVRGTRFLSGKRERGWGARSDRLSTCLIVYFCQCWVDSNVL